MSLRRGGNGLGQDNGRAHSLGLLCTIQQVINARTGSGQCSPWKLPWKALPSEQQPLGSSAGPFPSCARQQQQQLPDKPELMNCQQPLELFSADPGQNIQQNSSSGRKRPDKTAALCSRGRKLGSQGMQEHPGPLGLVATTPPSPLSLYGEGLGGFHCSAAKN